VLNSRSSGIVAGGGWMGGVTGGGGECASGHCPWRSLSPAQGPLGPGDKFRGKISRSVWKKSRIVKGLRIHGGDCQACGL